MHETVTRPRRLRGTLTPPGDRSISVRAALFNALAEGEARVSNYGPGDDCASALAVLRGLGAAIEPDGDGFVIGDSPLSEPGDVLDAGNSGTVMRLSAGALAGLPFFSVLTGDASLRRRPMGRVVAPLREMGAAISARDGGRLAPLAIHGGDLRGIRYTMPVASAQVKSCLLLAGLFAEGETVLEQPAVSRDHTERAFRAMGVPVEERGLELRMRPGQLHALDVTVPGDISSAAFWMVAAACHPDAEVRAKGIGINPGRTGILDVLSAMGAGVTLENERDVGGEPVADVVVRSSELQAVEIAGDLIPRVQDEIPVLALAACFARGTTVVADAEELRVKETDRIRAIVTELRRLGAEVEETPDGMTISGGRTLQGVEGEHYGDHRMAMMLGVAGLVAEGGTTVEGDVASVTYPSFWSDLRRLVEA